MRHPHDILFGKMGVWCVILQKPRKGGAPVTSPDFEVGVKKGGRGCGGGVQTTHPTACTDSSKKTKIHAFFYGATTYNNSTRIFRTVPSPYMAREEMVHASACVVVEVD